MCKEIGSKSFNNRIICELFTYESYMYIYLDICKQMTDIKLLLLHSNKVK